MGSRHLRPPARGPSWPTGPGRTTASEGQVAAPLMRKMGLRSRNRAVRLAPDNSDYAANESRCEGGEEVAGEGISRQDGERA